MLKIPQNEEFIINRLLENGHKAYIVGGCVRDILLGKTPDDYDITTSATPEEIIALFDKTIPTGIKHGTVTVIINNTAVEVTTFRTENGYADNRHPDSVEFVRNIKEDLSRRDFTINAMAYNEQEGLIDLFGGKKDLENKILRTVGDSQTRFREDALRILRLFRFASVLGFSIEESTLNSALDNAHLLENVSRERIFTELKKAIKGENFEIFKELIICGGLEFLNINKIPNFEKIKKHRENPLLCLYSFLDSTSLEKLKPSNKEREFFVTLHRLSKLPHPKTDSDIKEMLNICGDEILKDFFIYNEWDVSPIERIVKSGEPYKISHLKIDGKALIELGYKGEKIGEILEHLRKAVIESPHKNNTEDLIKEIP
ncbi:MAG: CCA tRNA nucleotidyltransferase [Clostridia bacterium]|nr:CCA tRNA nucleotidyltransferase [Clostridia bacterium]